MPFLKFSGKCADGYKALEYIGRCQIGLLFPDIQMPGFSGLELSCTLQNDIQAVLTRAFHQYAVEGYKPDITDYLLKPFS